MDKPIADLHCHPSLKPHLNETIPSIWHPARNPMASQVFRAFSIRRLALAGTLDKLARISQSNLDACLAGGNRLLFCSLYPFEREFLRPDRPFDTYRTAADLPAFRDKLVEALKTQERAYMKEFRVLSLPSEVPMEAGEIRRLMKGQTPEQIVERVFYGNTRRFLKTYFTDAYRYQQPIA